ncbi:WXG100 family type VII secretion target [Streptomyces bambusae]|uniref:WXG100 family type VII secretion target n=1 Tax=Streptomyces bambusae TaxID=1550616 RepID=UPI001CFFA853|nr:WXG100 family type VII secretion target [Streptomyces bambusae]MCB5169960.1 WXG100 family type VII secretion target [Streptomyces bambusae]
MPLAVNYDTVATAADDVRRTAQHLTHELDRLMAQVRAAAAVWEGEAKTAYADVQQTVSTEMAGMNAKLGTIAGLLDSSLIGYQDTDRGNAARFRML